MSCAKQVWTGLALGLVFADFLSATSLDAAEPTAQQSAPVDEWHYYGRDPASTKYSSLDLINRDNVKNLKIAWRWKSENFGTRPEYNMEETPLMVDGVLYFMAGTRRTAVAVDAQTGETLWMYRLDEGARGRVAPRPYHRGVAYWTDGKDDKRIVLITAGYHMVQLNATTGRPVEQFGQGGIVDLYKDFDQPEPEDGKIGSSSPAIIVGDIIVVGGAMGSIAASKENVKSYVRGYNVRTGKREWIFHTIPKPGEFGYETWENGSEVYTGNTGVWAMMSADPELGYVYLPVETPTNDFYGGDRPGDNLFAESLVCLDAKTGKRVWHFQFVHHGIWDYDIPTAPILLDIKVKGKKIKAVAQLTKQAWVYVFDRVTGKPVWPIIEKKVPPSGVPGEKTARTQPYPTWPAPFDVQAVSQENLIDFTPVLRKEAIEIISQYELGDMFTPPAPPRNGKNGVLKLPSPSGGANWQGGAADPETGIIYIASSTYLFGPSPYRIPGQPAPSVAVKAMSAPGDTSPKYFGPQGLPLIKPPYGRITAIDLNTGDHLWMVANADTPAWIKNHPALKGVNLPRTGTPERAGIMVTKSLLFAGEGAGLFATPSESGGNKFRAYDKRTGEIVSEFELPASQSGVPMTYAIRGRQYIVVAVGGVGKPAELVALTTD
ncbi:pyrroloquinoline quinone-dependent dehydrogenase [Denitratisoma oestradiolicum]|uniref:Pyrrolo-quinoline quinone repeat domain-containing protein n=1 Tax=Denitratisoma oestradiolicum TaxID=311182 RepID=A0A6S6XVA3_9PROT|nr:pyrroloquinoline quinone-dependent dehydrogenase [Denitratisoma oestradiolicum]TWO78716.1 hypothetical protein CBW56_18645 [Denitratisoma oestradiolicum]CAB1369857.1 conserved exported protein of unknown function [Denitratisoma oestradiolicum]